MRRAESMRLCSFPQGDGKRESRMWEPVGAATERPKNKRRSGVLSKLLGGVWSKKVSGVLWLLLLFENSRFYSPIPREGFLPATLQHYERFLHSQGQPIWVPWQWHGVEEVLKKGVGWRWVDNSRKFLVLRPDSDCRRKLSSNLVLGGKTSNW